VFGVAVMPFGLWTFATYVLQGAMAARLSAACGNRSPSALIAAAILAVCNIPFLWRLGHTALSSHFLILWALALYFESTMRRRLRAVELCVMLALAVMVNSYLAVMIAVLGGATTAAMWQRKQLEWRDARTLAIGLLVVFLEVLAMGYGVLLIQPTAMEATGFGVYSWNLVTLLIPPPHVWGITGGIVRDATGGQIEGETYIGLGALLMLLTALVTSRGALFGHVRRHIILVAALALLAAAAASNMVYVGDTLVLSYGLPAPLAVIANALRGSARFIWPLAYLLMIVPMALVFRRLPRRWAAGLAVVAMIAQVTEVIPTLQTVRLSTSQPFKDLVDNSRFTQWMQTHDRLWQYPSWPCGGLAGSARVWPGTEAFRELQVQLLAARHNRPTNTVYTSRSFKDCAREAEWSQQPQLTDGVLYLLGPEAVAESIELMRLASSGRCHNLTWAYACSAKWSRRTATRPGG
jgi:hypothetical protein